MMVMKTTKKRKVLRIDDPKKMTMTMVIVVLVEVVLVLVLLVLVQANKHRFEVEIVVRGKAMFVLEGNSCKHGEICLIKAFF